MILAGRVLRLKLGADHRVLLPCAFLLGGAFLIVCDTLSRTVIAPTEIPVGVLTAFPRSSVSSISPAGGSEAFGSAAEAVNAVDMSNPTMTVRRLLVMAPLPATLLLVTSSRQPHFVTLPNGMLTVAKIA
jgi:hypothetical protein